MPIERCIGGRGMDDATKVCASWLPVEVAICGSLLGEAVKPKGIVD